MGGGLAGVCAAIASARKGARTAIIQNRSMFGGNASSEIRMHIVGANSHGAKKNLGETGILLEILLANKRRNPYASFPVFDSVICQCYDSHPLFMIHKPSHPLFPTRLWLYAESFCPSS